MKTVFIDIETIPGSQWYQDKLALDVQPPGNYKNPDAILKWWDEVGNAKREEAHKTAALSPFCNIICIGWAVDDGPLCSATGATEREVLEQFSTQLRKDLTDPVKGFTNPRFVGHNILGFDLPRLFQRMVVNGIDPEYVRIKSPALIKGWDDAYYDTLNVFAGRDTKGCSLANLCMEFGIEDKMPDMDGSKVYGLYQEGRIAEIAAYCREDVRLVRELYKRLEVLEAMLSALTAALAAAPKADVQEPVAFEVSCYGGRVECIVVREDVAQERASKRIECGAEDVRIRPLYAAPQPVSDDAKDARIKVLENLLYYIKDELDGFSGFDGTEHAVFIELSGDIDAAMEVSDDKARTTDGDTADAQAGCK